MKMKGITLVEQHIEKGVLGLAIVGLLGIGAWQFLSRPNQVTVDGGPVNPGEIDGILRERAEALNLQLRDTAPMVSDPFGGDPPLQAAQFVASLADGLPVDDRLPRIQPSLAQALVPIDLGTDIWYTEPSIPAPRIVAEVQQTDDAILAETLEQFPDLAQRFPDSRETRDVSFLTPTATIDPVAIRAEMRASDPNANPPRSAVPNPWYNDRIYVLDVLCEREERLPNGTFGNRVQVATIPGQVTLRPELASNPDATARNQMLDRLGDDRFQRLILQPDFLPTRNSAFTPPSATGETAGAGRDPVRDPGSELRDALERITREVERVRERLTEAGGPLEDERPAGRPPRDGGDTRGGPGGAGGVAPPGSGGPGGGLGGGLGGGASGGADGGAGAGDRGSERERRSLTRRLRSIEERRDAIEAQLREVAPELLEGAIATERPFNLAGDDPIQIWAHDIDVRPGGTYRYRFVVRTYNPFFARKRQLVEEQAELADRIALESAASDWTNAVEVTPQVALFVSRAVPGEGPLGLGTAQIEVFRLHEGKWRREIFSVAPGDQIGRVVEPGRGRQGETAVDFSTEWFVVDIVDDPAGEMRADRSRPALVVLQRAGSSERFEVRDPVADQSNPKRLRLYRDFSVG